MAGGPRLELRQSQSLVMTPQLQQSIKMLQLSSTELTAHIDEALQSNPLLQVEESNPNKETETQPESSLYDEADQWLQQQEKGASPLASTEQLDHNMDTNWDGSDAVPGGLHEPSYQRYEGIAKQRFGNEANPIEQVSQNDLSLQAHLEEQLPLLMLDNKQHVIASHLLDALDESGYFTDNMETIAELLGCEQHFIEEVLELLQTLEPAGVFARSLQECLTLQLKAKDHFDPSIAKLLEHLDLIAEHNFKRLQLLCDMDKEDLEDAIAEIKSLDPKPGIHFSSEIVQTVKPDIFLQKGTEGQWIVELNQEVLPRLIVDRQYYTEIRKKAANQDDKEFLSNQYAEAQGLIKSLDQRAKTILKVAKQVTLYQEGFFEKGIHHLKPLTLADIAEAIEMHESTVSRVINQKYMATPYGLYELKYFFSSGLQKGAGEDAIASTSVKHLIKEMIEKEEPTSILSDDKIASLLKEKSINVARRTVAKYREAMHIPTSSVRKREKRA